MTRSLTVGLEGFGIGIAALIVLSALCLLLGFAFGDRVDQARADCLLPSDDFEQHADEAMAVANDDGCMSDFQRSAVKERIRKILDAQAVRRGWTERDEMDAFMAWMQDSR